MTQRETRLRELVACYEWNDPTNMAAASVLQTAADAMVEGSISDEAADLLIATWEPLAGDRKSGV